MHLYIETESGMAKNHPAFFENLIQAFGSVPEHWEPFVRVERPIPGVYQLLESEEAVYAKVGGVWTDVWALRPMTEAEKAAKQQIAKDAWAALPNHYNFTAWTFDEATLTYQPPILRPAPVEGKTVFWSGADGNWKEAPARPEGNYRFDFLVWTWVAI